MVKILAARLHHMRLHPADSDGEVKVTHHASAESKPHAEHWFSEEKALHDHVMQHMGLESVPESPAEMAKEREDAHEAPLERG